MAYPTRQRDPLLDSNMQAAIERRGKELLGAGLAIAGILAAMMIWSYSPDDPSWMSETGTPVKNWLGSLGATMSGMMFLIIGYAAWGLPIALLGWSARFMFHSGSERAIQRSIFVPIAIAVAAIYAATLTSDNVVGMGGLMGDTVLGFILNVAPFQNAFLFKILSAALGLGMIAMALFALGFIKTELQTVMRFLIVGVIMTYAQLMTLMGRGARGAAIAAQAARDNRAERRETARIAAEEQAAYDYANQQMFETPEAPVQRVQRAEPLAAPVAAPVAEPEPAPQTRTGLLARVPSLMKRAEPEEEHFVEPPIMAEAPADGDDRIKGKISDAIKTRARNAHVRAAMRNEPRLTRRGPDPLIVDTTPQPAPVAPAAAPMLEQPVSQYMEPEAPVLEDIQPEPIEQPTIADPAGRVLSRAPIAAAPIAKPVVQHTPRKAVQPSARAQQEAQPALQFEESKISAFEFPPLNLLRSPDTVDRHHLSDEALEENARMLENVLDDYGVKGEIVSVRPGPVVTMYELEPAPGLKASRVIGLADDIARSMSALAARVSTVPGRSVIGIELPNENREMVVLREILAARDFGDSNMKLPLALGKDIGGDPIVANLAKMPHLLIAGTTGSGKSVAINTMILSLLYKLSPEECRLIMIDPKMLELSVYDGIPHLLSPVVTDPKKAVVALKWVVGEMEDRYRKMSKMGVRNIDGYNGRVKDALAKNEMFERTVQTGFDEETGDPIFETEMTKPEILPYIVVVVDEMADLMMVAGKEIEACIQRLAQMARASGIHLIMATQRPSVDVITGTIKANFPTRISFQVTSKIDSRTILGEQGAEQLLGMGDMLYMAGGAKITRIHGPFCSDEEVEEIVTHLKSFGPPDYMSGVVEGPDEGTESDIDLVLGLGGNTTGEDALYDQAVAIVAKDRKCSTSYIQRKLAIGYNKAARLVEQMEDQGLVSAANHVGKREILLPEQQ